MPKGKPTSKHHEDAIIAAYLNGATQKEAAALFGYSRDVCQDILRRNGIETRPPSKTNRRYTVDHNFFDTISTEAKAYWLGFLTADGCVSCNNIILGLHTIDLDHIYKFAAALCCKYPITFKEDSRNGSPFASININSEQLVKALACLGVGEHKSLTVQPCQRVPDHFLRHYWRGIMDGDGSISYNKADKSWHVRLFGNEAIVRGFCNFLSQFVNSKATVRRHKTIFEIQYVGNRLASAILQVLYANATIYLDRKYDLAQKVLNRHLP